jgi:hypothetical protein
MVPSDSHAPLEHTLRRAEAQYAAQFCEENIWHLCQHPKLAELERHVVFISNYLRCCPFWEQRAGAEGSEPILWDYHVILFTRRSPDLDGCVFDLDTRLDFPSGVEGYLQQTFRNVALLPTAYQPMFRVTSAVDYVATFSSDRSHMRDDRGNWLAPPPTWPPIMGDNQQTLPDYMNFQSKTFGEAIDIDAFRLWSGGETKLV